MTNKILIIGPAWVGDMVMAQTLFTLMKQHNATVEIDVIAPAWSQPLLARMPEVNNSMVMPLGHGQLNLRQRYKIAQQLQSQGYNHAIVLPNSWKSALIPFWAKIPWRTGWVGEMRWGLLNDSRKLDKAKLPLMIERFMALGLIKDAALPKDYPRPHLMVDEKNIAKALNHQGLTQEKPILALCPGAEFGPAKRWPAKHYAAIAKSKLEQGWQVWIFGSKNDSPVATEIQKSVTGACFDLTGKTSLGEAIDLMSVANEVVTNDSGLMHIAAALDRPMVAVYGSSSPTFTPPLSEKVKILRTNISCSPCFKRECPLKHLQCLEQLEPGKVIQALTEVTDS